MLFQGKKITCIITYNDKTNNYVYGGSSPRGRILDRNGKVLVDNVAANTIIYRHLDNTNIKDVALFLSKNLTNLIDADENEQINYYIGENNVEDLLTDEEQDLFNHRKISVEQRENLIKERVKEYLDYSEEEKKQIHLYYLLEKGYSYSNKIIASDVSDKECANVAEANIIGLTCEQTPKRVYLYDSMNAIYGSVGQISKENKSY